MACSDEALRRKWDERHGAAEDLGRLARVLEENQHLLPASGEALDLACGRGANALKLAELGLSVSAWDLSPVAIEGLAKEASLRGLPVSARVRDVIVSPPAPQTFDVVLVAHFLERHIVPAIIAALRPGGLLLYQTFAERVVDEGPLDPMFRLGDNELLRLFAPLKIRVYREEAAAGDMRRGWRGLAMLVAQKGAAGPDGLAPIADRKYD